MSRLHRAWEKIPVQGDLQLLTADQVRLLSGREPRLMMKFDHSHTLPPELRESGRFILPLRNGLYAIIKGEGYHRPEPLTAVEVFPPRTRFDLKTTETGISEMQHLDIAFNTGLLASFLKEPVLYPTIRGRKRSPNFQFRVGQHELEVEGVQVEIDGGFEGRHSVTVVEAKIGECEDFHLRQIYYPYRFWSSLTKKKVRPVFFTYDPADDVYRFREYRFDPPERYGRPELVQSAAYRLGEPQQTWLDSVKLQAGPVPQADRLDKVALVPFLVAEGSRTPEQLAPLLEFSPRQGRYYLDAARSLGLLDERFELTPAGLDYISATPELRRVQLCQAVLKLPLCQELLSGLLLAPGATLSKSEVEELTTRATGLAPNTAARRTRTLWSWLCWVATHSEVLHLNQDSVTLKSGKMSPPSSQQLDLFS